MDWSACRCIEAVRNGKRLIQPHFQEAVKFLMINSGVLTASFLLGFPLLLPLNFVSYLI